MRDRLGNLAGAADGLPAQVVRLDRYGFVVTVGPADARLQARLSFPARYGTGPTWLGCCTWCSAGTGATVP